MLQLYVDRSKLPNFDPSTTELIKRRPMFPTTYVPLILLSEAPSLRDLRKSCKTIMKRLYIVGELVRLLLVLHDINPRRASIEVCCKVYEDLSGDGPAARSAGTLINIIRPYKSELHVCFAIRSLKITVEDLWMNKLSKERTAELACLTDITQVVLSRVKPAKRNVDRSNDWFDKSHLQLEPDLPAPTDAEYAIMKQKLMTTVKMTGEEKDIAKRYR